MGRPSAVTSCRPFRILLVALRMANNGQIPKPTVYLTAFALHFVNNQIRCCPICCLIIWRIRNFGSPINCKWLNFPAAESLPDLSLSNIFVWLSLICFTSLNFLCILTKNTRSGHHPFWFARMANALEWSYLWIWSYCFELWQLTTDVSFVFETQVDNFFSSFISSSATKRISFVSQTVIRLEETPLSERVRRRRSINKRLARAPPCSDKAIN